MTNDYVPIVCDAHSVLELLAMRRTEVRIDYVPPAGELEQLHGVVEDIVIRDRAEHLVLNTGGQSCLVRLDGLRAIYDGSDKVFPCQ